MVQDFTLRRAKLADMEPVAQLFRRVRKTSLPFLPDFHTQEEDVAFFGGYVFEHCEVWVAEGSGLLGFCAFREGWIDHLYVESDQHGRGVGSALIAKAMATHSPLNLWVFQKNAQAIRFYEAKGFWLVERTDGADNEEKEPDALYAWAR